MALRALVRRQARDLLGPTGLAALRGVKSHVSSAYSILRGRGSPPSVSDFVTLDVEELLRGVRRYRRAETEQQEDRIADELMRRVAVDQRYVGLVESSYFRAETPARLGPPLLGAALYGAGRIDEACRVFEQAAGTHASVQIFYCLARCWSHGLMDHGRSLEAAESGLRRFPESTLLTMVAAVAAYRLGDTEAANRRLDSKRDAVVRMLRAAFPGAGLLQGELDRALASGAETRDTSYSDDVIETYWNLLWRNMECFSRSQNGWASLRWLQRANLEATLHQVAPDVDVFVNFGAFCGRVDADLAGEFPGIAFHGVDLGARTKVLNDKAFRLPNLEFHDAFILDYLDGTDLGGKTPMLFHARTGTLFYPKFLERLYRRCASKGIRYVALWENNSLSHSSARFHEFGAIPGGSVAYRDIMFIHDYKPLLEGAGYELVRVVRSASNAILVEDDALAADGHVFVVARLR